MTVIPPNDRSQQRNRAASQSRLVRAIVNPNEVIAEFLPQPKQHPNGSRLEESKLARAIGGGNINYGIGGDCLKELPPSDEPLVPVTIDTDIEDKLPRGYNIRSLQREDYDNGYLHLKHVGNIARTKWDERCEYLRSRKDTYIPLVIANSENWVVCSGTLVIERKFTHDLCLVGHVEDLLVAEGQSGKNLGGRMLEALDKVAKDMGCYKTMTATTEVNESFHEEKGFKRAGSEVMSHRHFVPRKTVRPRDSSRDPSPNHVHDGYSEAEGKQMDYSVTPVSSMDA
ncbi:hypothetical protein Q7P37_002038 [Cladosporium fusiforme]